jgi:hypothetical protein
LRLFTDTKKSRPDGNRDSGEQAGDRVQDRSRFGIKLFWTQIQKPEHLARFMLILAFALLILTAIGCAILQIIPSANMPPPSKGSRLSFISIAINYGLEVLPRPTNLAMAHNKSALA